MKFACPYCDQHMECDNDAAGRVVRCPSCGDRLKIPKPESAEDAPSPELKTLKDSVQSGAKRGEMTISKFMSEQNMDGGVQLDDTSDPSSASSVLTTDQGSKYQLGAAIAHGGMGAILDAKDVNIRRPVAMKVMLDPKKASKEEVLRFIEEAQITGQLEHPGIVPVHELGVDASGNVFYTMKMVSGSTLKQILKEIEEGNSKTAGEYPLARLLTIYQRICDAMAYAHSKRVIHRDLKPENIMIGDYGEVLVLDWGLAKVLPKKKVKRFVPKRNRKAEARRKQEEEEQAKAVRSVRDDDESGDLMKTMDGGIMGTPGFMSPEQALGDTESIDERADIYALGAILYNMLTLHKPVEGDTLGELLKKATTGDIPHPSAFNPTGKHAAPSVTLPHLPALRIPDSLSSVAMKALALQMDSRYQHVKELQADIEAYQGGFATSAEEAGMLKQAALFFRRHKVVASLGVAVFLAVLGGSIISTTQWIKARKAVRDLNGTAPALAILTRAYMEANELDEALKMITYACELIPTNSSYHLARGHILQGMLRLKKSTDSYSRALQYEPGSESARINKEINEELMAKGGGGNKLKLSEMARLYQDVVKQERYPEARAIAKRMTGSSAVVGGEAIVRGALAKAGIKARSVTRDSSGALTVDLAGSQISDLGALRGLPIANLSLAGCKNVKDLVPLQGMPLKSLNLSSTAITDLSQLKGMSLESLILAGCVEVEDISPLRGMNLKSLNLTACQKISSLSPLKGMPLTALNLTKCSNLVSLAPLRGMPLRTLQLAFARQISDLSPLKGMSLETLTFNGCPGITDISALKGMPLQRMWMSGTVKDLSPLKGMTTLGVSGVQSILPPVIDAFRRKDLVGARLQLKSAIAGYHNVPAYGREVSFVRELYDAMQKPPKYPSGTKLFNGHHYWFLLERPMRWAAAQAIAEGIGGHLVTITTDQERSFIAKNAGKSHSMHVGFILRAGGPAWVSGERWNNPRWYKGGGRGNLGLIYLGGYHQWKPGEMCGWYEYDRPFVIEWDR